MIRTSRVERHPADKHRNPPTIPFNLRAARIRRHEPASGLSLDVIGCGPTAGTTMLFQFLRPQLERERPTITSTARRAGESGRMAIGAHMSVALASDASIRSPAPVVTVKARRSPAP